jgi:DNA modification methylase
MGSGTTGVAAVMAGRNFIGIEKNEEYYVMAEQRINEVRKSEGLQRTV